MINIAICDDDKNTATEIENLILRNDRTDLYAIDIFLDGKEFLSADLSKFDMVFLDIEIGEINGIDIAVQLRKVNEIAIIFFITNHFRYISEALKSMPFQYILKPISEKRELFFEEFNRGLNKLKKIKHTIKIATQHGEEIIKVDSINYLEYLNKSIILHMDSGEVKFSGRLKEWIDKLLPYDFVQCHKSFLVNLNHVEKVKFNQIIMCDEQIVPIGRKYSQTFGEKRNKFLSGVSV